MAERLITKANVWEDSDCVCMARVVGIDADEITQADVSSITLKVFDEDAADPDAAVSTASLTVSAVVFNTLQTDARWQVDTTGYNFRYTIPAAALATGDHTYTVEFVFTMADTTKFPPIFMFFNVFFVSPFFITSP